jgi:putative tryptophan/tyrosine transport system substrate-binding protein
MMPPKEGPPMERRSRLSRRQFVLGASAAGLGLVAGCGRLPWQEPPPAKVYRIGYLSPRSRAVTAPRFDAFRQGLQELGWIEGQNFIFEQRLAEGQAERLPDLAAELVRLQPDVLVTFGEPASRALRTATQTIPIVFSSHADPVGMKLVESFAHPGGNVTGVSEMAPELAGKRLELLKAAVPTVARVGVIFNVGDQAMVREYGETLVGAERDGVEVVTMGVRTPGEIDQAYQTAVEGRLDGIVVILDPLIVSSRDRLVELSTRHGLPTISGDTGFALAGGLMAYGPNLVRQTQRAAYFVDRILKGAKPADLPVEQPMRFDFVVNLKTARELGITFPHEILLQVTEVIQ